MAGICAGLVGLVFMVFGQTVRFDFVNYDDNDYVYDNPVVSKGLSLERVEWAFTHVHANNWHPLTTICHMLDCQVYGLWPGGHHLTNTTLHAACAVLLFLLLIEMTGALWPSAFVAALFAIHPLRVESVAWVSDLKDVLSGIFFMLTLWAYTRYARRPQSRGRYAMVAVWLACGLLSKPMLVTTPFILLLLDFWPLERLQRKSQIPSLLFEKLPLFALSAATCVATIIAQRNAIAPLDHLSFSDRITNALVAFCVYPWKLIYPAHLALLYPIPRNGWAVWQVIGAIALLTAITGISFALRRKQPFVLVGWLWYLGMLVPVIGIVQVGTQAYADRYTYLSEIGLSIAITWSVTAWAGKRRYRAIAMGAAAAVYLCALLAAAHQQASYWRNSIAIWTHTLETTTDNVVAHENLGAALLQQGRAEESIAQCNMALQINPIDATALYNLANALLLQGRTDDAIAKYRETLQIDSTRANAHFNLGDALAQQQRTEEAIAEYRETIRIDPARADVLYNLGNALMHQGRAEEAIAQFSAALRIKPADASTYSNLGVALLSQGRTSEAIDAIQKAIDLQPDNVQGQNNLALILATTPQLPLRNGTRALELASGANQSTSGKNPMILRTLAAAYAQAGKFPEAVQTAQIALHLAELQGNTALTAALHRELPLYEAGHVFEN